MIYCVTLQQPEDQMKRQYQQVPETNDTQNDFVRCEHELLTVDCIHDILMMIMLSQGQQSAVTTEPLHYDYFKTKI